MGWVDDKMRHCIWKRQPETSIELDQAVRVLEVQELGCHRYAGNDPAILKRISPEHCDYPAQSRSAFQRKQMVSSKAVRLSSLNDRDGLLTRIWKHLTGKKNE
jgi:hypothetical protein